MVDNIRNNDVSRHMSAEPTEAKKEKPASQASDQDISLFKKAMGKDKATGKKEGKMGGKTSGIGSKARSGATQFSTKQAGEKGAVESSDTKASHESKIKTDLFDKTEKSEHGIRQDQQRQTVLKENVVNQVVNKAQALNPNPELKKSKRNDVSKSKDDTAISGTQSSSVKHQFSVEMTSQTQQAAPIDKQAVIDQIDKISDYITMQANDMGETQSMNVKFKNDVLPDTTLTINKSEDGAFEISFKTENEDSQNLIAQNQNSLLESLNNNTQGLSFQVKLG